MKKCFKHKIHSFNSQQLALCVYIYTEETLQGYTVQLQVFRFVAVQEKHTDK